MKVNELSNELKELGVPEFYYSILTGGLPNERLCIVETDLKKWEVYYSERGEKSNVRIFDLESDACEYFLKKLKKYAKVI